MKTVNWASFALVVAAALSGITGAAEERATVEYSWDVKAHYPETGVAKVDTTIREWLAEHINEHVRENAGVLVEPDYPDGGWDMAVNYHTRTTGGALSVVFETVVSPEGAAHPMTYVETLLFALPGGERLEWDDIFANPEKALAILAEHAEARVLETMRGKGDERYAGIGRDAWFGDGFTPTRENYAAMSVEPGGVRVVFQRYQVLPYAYGNPEAFFPLELLDAAGPVRGLWR